MRYMFENKFITSLSLCELCRDHYLFTIMSDSDSSDNFRDLITNSEQNFWKTYATTLRQESSDAGEQPSSSSTANVTLTPIIHTKRRRQSTSEDSSDDEPESLQKTTSKSCTAGKSNKTHADKKIKRNESSSAQTRKRRTVSDTSASAQSSHSDHDDNGSRHAGTKTKKMSLLGAILKTLTTQPASADPSAATTSTRVNPLENQPNSPPTQKSRGRPRRSAAKNKASQRTTKKRRQTRRRAEARPPDETINSSNSSTPDYLDDEPATPPQTAESDAHHNRLVDVRVLWKSAHRKIFQVRRFTPLKVIVEHLARAENANPRHVCFFVDDKLVDLSAHSCVTLRYRPGEQLDGGVLDGECPPPPTEARREPRRTRLLVRRGRRSEAFLLRDDARLEQLYAGVVLRYALKFGTFRLEFDGHIIGCHETVHDVGLEPDDCIDIWE